MATHNDILLAAAIAGITGGVNDGKDLSQTSSATLGSSAGLTLTAAIAAAAAAVDAAIPFDAQLSVSSSNSALLVTPFAGSGSAAQILPIFTKPAVLQAICFAAFRGKSDIESAVVSSYATLAAGIAAQYAATVALLPAS